MRRPLLLLPTFAAALLLASPASATPIAYEIGDLGPLPFSGLFAEQTDDDDDDDGSGGSLEILSDDLTGRIALAAEDGWGLADGPVAVVELSLSGSLTSCRDCTRRALAIELDPSSASLLELENERLSGDVHLLVRVDGDLAAPVTVPVLGRTRGGDANTATSELLTLLLALDAGIAGDDDDDDDGGGGGSAGLAPLFATPGGGGYDDDDGDDDDGARHVFLQAQGNVVPEPGTALLIGLGLLGLALPRRS